MPISFYIDALYKGLVKAMNNPAIEKSRLVALITLVISLLMCIWSLTISRQPQIFHFAVILLTISGILAAVISSIRDNRS